MARYIRFSPKFWKNKRVRSLSEDARMLYAYLITCPHGNCMGMFSLPAAYGADDLQWLPERFAKGFAELFREGFVNHDPATDLVLVVKFLEHTPLENGNQVTGALTQLAELPTSSLWKNLYDILEPLGKPFLKPLLEALSKPFAKGFMEPLPEGYAKQVTVTVPVTVSVSETVTEGGAGETASSDGGENSDATETERLILHELQQIPGYKFDFTKDLEYLRLLSIDFPKVDLLNQVKAWRIYKIDKPLKTNANAHSQFRNWCQISQERGTFDGNNGTSWKNNSRPSGSATDTARRPTEKDYTSGRLGSIFFKPGTEKAESDPQEQQAGNVVGP